MPTPLPARPDLEHLRKQAKDLLKSHKSGDPAALRRFRENHPEFASAPDPRILAAEVSLADAQLVLAREHGFASWPKLKEHMESLLLETRDPLELFKQAFHADDASLIARLLERYPAFKARLNEPIGPFDSQPITQVRSRAMLDVFLDAGADINAKSRWWAGGFGLLHNAPPELATYAIGRGAIVDVHAAARLGLMARLRDLVIADPGLVHARGGDGQTPLHFAGSVEVAEFLLNHGAGPDARDVDHESTPAQWMLGDRQDVARFLVQRGCRTDLLMAVALGDLPLVRRHLDADPASISLRVDDEHFPKIHPRAGGTIYQWTLGSQVSAHDVARKFGHAQVLQLLLERSPAEVKLLSVVLGNDEAAVKVLLAAEPDLIARLSETTRRELAHAARNNSLTAVRLLLQAGWPVDARGQHQGTALHWAAFHGNLEMVEALLPHHPPLDLPDADHHAPPIGWATHGSEHGWYRETGNYAGVVEALLRAGATPPAQPGGTEAVRAVLRRHGVTESRR
ncbi:MAG: ankyrin repeat domain-containing protein [Verrucomicrobia bacterium]|nr:ankyrin repeat domain-containing protein [Verrucomicrobiota bacterium]